MSSGWTVGQVAQAAGVTVRTLHHWEQVGLLVPSGRTGAGYRVYDGADLDRLQRVLAYRELGFGLDAVRGLLDGDADVVDELRRQAVLLRDRAARLLQVAAALETNVEARRMGIELEPHELLEVFGDDDPTQHAAEAEQRWGDTDAWRQSHERTRRYGKQDWLRLRAQAEDLESRMAAATLSGARPGDAEASALVEEHSRSIEAYYDCSPEMHRGLGRMYVDDERFTAHYDRRAPGLAAWLHEAIEATYGA
jgi:DNA-binding transcriptional MerR regulator